MHVERLTRIGPYKTCFKRQATRKYTHAHTHAHMDNMYARNMHPRIMHRRGNLNHIDKVQELTANVRDRGSDGKSEISRNGVTSEKSKRIFRVRSIRGDGIDEICTEARVETRRDRETNDFRQNGRETFRNYCSFEGAITE